MAQGSIISAADLQSHPEYIYWMIAIIAIDNLNTMLPFALLRRKTGQKICLRPHCRDRGQPVRGDPVPGRDPIPVKEKP